MEDPGQTPRVAVMQAIEIVLHHSRDRDEFVIERAKFSGGAKRLRVEVRDFTGKAADIVFPAGSSRFEPGGWRALRFE